MIGIELVKDRQTKEKAIERKEQNHSSLFEKGLLILGRGNVIPSVLLDHREERGGHCPHDLRGSVAEGEKDIKKSGRRSQEKMMKCNGER